MRVYGLDFTSAPRPAKPIALASARREGDRLKLESLLAIPTFDGFVRCLEAPGTWVAAMDLPFGQPRRLVERLGWPTAWPELVAHLERLGRPRFERRLQEYKDARDKGDKEHLRVTDRVARSLSPMKLYGVPLAKMFWEGAVRLRRSGLNVMPCRPTEDSRVVVEGYPGLLARALIGRRSYKAENRAAQSSERRRARAELIDGLGSAEFASRYGFRLAIGRFHRRELEADARGDLLDAVLCAAQAAWAADSRRHHWGVPMACDELEGWIVDPATELPGPPGPATGGRVAAAAD